ncbi:hypothetical protein HA075_22330 [bacterium BFN5]|nr:hypothetical protein HA075_22330 [bacterium BFN5]
MVYKLPPYENIAAILPRYSTQGDHAVVISTDGLSTCTANSVRTLIKRLARSRSTDLVALRAHTARATQRSILQPLPLAPGLVLVPVKVRQPRISGDNCTGYVNLHAITAVTTCKQQPYRSTLSLAGNTEVPALWSTTTINRQLQCARLALDQITMQQTLRESPANYTAIATIATKLIEVIYDILTLKRKA